MMKEGFSQFLKLITGSPLTSYLSISTLPALYLKSLAIQDPIYCQHHSPLTGKKQKANDDLISQ